MANLFSHPKYLEIVASSLFPDKNYSLVTFSCQNKNFASFTVKGKKPEIIWPFMDFFEPLENKVENKVPQVSSVPRVMIADISTQEWKEHYSEKNDCMAAPYIQWANISDFDSFKKICKENDNRAFSKRTNAKIKKISNQIGEYRYIHQVENEKAKTYLKILMDWKSAQYRRSGYQDMFALMKYRDIFFNLLDANLLLVSALEAGDKVLAIHAGYLFEGRLYYLLPAYDVQYTKYSIGTLLMEEMMSTSYARGDKEFDFLLGDEDYKFSYANRVRVINKVGVDFWMDKVWLPIRRSLITYIRKVEIVYLPLKKVKRIFKEKGWL